MTTTTKETHSEPSTNDPTESPWNEAHQSEEGHSSVTQKTLKQSADKISQTKKKIARSATELKEKAGQYYRDTSDATARTYSKLSDQASETYSNTKTRVKDSFHQHPIAFTAGTFALGLALGLAIPQLRKEKKVLSKSGERVRKAAGEAKERVSNAAQSAKTTAVESLKDKGLDPQSVQESLKEVGEDSIDSAQDSLKK